MSDQGSSAPPQWADDPSGRHRFRFWDGSRWTAHVYDGPSPPEGAPGAGGDDHSMFAPDARVVVAPTERPVVEPEHHEYAAEVEPEDLPDEGRRGRRGGSGRGRGRGRGGSANPTRATFLKGAAAGGGVVALIAILATVVLGGDGSKVSTTTTTKDESSTTTTSVTTLVTTTTLAPGRPPSEVRVIVLNGSGVGGGAGTMETKLKGLGYNVTSIGNADERTGTAIGCRPGFEAEAAALAAAVGSGATVGTFPTPEPANSADADCVVTLGK
ncbi:MAG: DUF2510 domain-containing protein [Acidimicrobiia bacterium]